MPKSLLIIFFFCLKSDAFTVPLVAYTAVYLYDAVPKLLVLSAVG